nr:protein yellow-like [Neodiprion pinetum]
MDRNLFCPFVIVVSINLQPSYNVRFSVKQNPIDHFFFFLVKFYRHSNTNSRFMSEPVSPKQNTVYRFFASSIYVRQVEYIYFHRNTGRHVRCDLPDGVPGVALCSTVYLRVVSAHRKLTRHRTVHQKAVFNGSIMHTSVKCLTLLLGVAAASLGPFEELYTWKQLDFQFPTSNAREAAIASGDFVQINNLPVGIEIWKDKLFVTVPRWKKGVPSNLNYISLSNTTGNKSPALTPYPDWETNDIHQTGKESIVNIFRLAVDSCDRLWGIDAGSDDILGEGALVAPVQLIVIDLKTDQVIRRYRLTDADQRFESFFANLVVDVEADACDQAFAYVSDLGANGLVVYSWEKNKSWRVDHNFFAFDPLHGDFNVSGINFQWTDGIFGLALSPLRSDGSKSLYFHALASITEFEVSTTVLKDEVLATSNGNYYHFKRLGYKGELSQCTASVMDWKTGVAFFAAVNRDGIACWNTKKSLDQSSFRLVAEDHDALVFPNDIKIAQDTRQLYVISDKMPLFQYANIDPQQINYRILKAPVDEAVKTCL